MIDQLVGPTVDWLAATGAPNGVVILAILTAPAKWSEAARKQYQRLIRQRAGSEATDGQQ